MLSFSEKTPIIKRLSQKTKGAIYSFKKIPKKKLILFCSIVIVGIIFLAASVSYFKLRQKNQLRHNPKAAQQAEEKEYVNELKNLTYPPDNETPSIAIIADADKARQSNATFYRQAKNGDVVLKYESIAYILDVKNHKLVNIGSVNN